jgi:ribosomal protein L11
MTPTVSYFLKSAAGIEKGAQKPGKSLNSKENMLSTGFNFYLNKKDVI